MAKKINITAQLNAATVEGVVASAEQIKDEGRNKFQSEINTDLEGRLKQEASVRNGQVKNVQANLDAEIATREVVYLGDLGDFTGVESVGFVDSLVASITNLGKGVGKYSFDIGGGGTGSKQFVTLAKVGSLTKLTIEGCLKAEVLNGDWLIDSVTSSVSTVVECDVTKKVWSYVNTVVDDTYYPEMLNEATVNKEAVQRSNKVMSKEQTLGVISEVKKVLEDDINKICDCEKDNPVKTEELYYNDGSDKVVPIRHPDLSTQPSILPYKFAGNYVYEQMFYIPAPIVTEGDYYKTLNRDVKGNIIILDHSLCLIDAKGYTRSSEGYSIYCFDNNNIVQDEGTEYLEGLCIFIDNQYPNNMNSITGAWVRVVWSAAPKISEDDYYYYQQQKVGRFLLSMSAYMNGYKYRLNEPLGGATIYEGNLITGGQVQLPPEFLDDFIDGGLNLTFVNPDEYNNSIAAIINDENYMSIYEVDPSGELSWDNFKYYFPKTCESLLNGNDVNFTIATT